MTESYLSSLVPLEYGFRLEVLVRKKLGAKSIGKTDRYWYSKNGTKLRSYPDILRYLTNLENTPVAKAGEMVAKLREISDRGGTAYNQALANTLESCREQKLAFSTTCSDSKKRKGFKEVLDQASDPSSKRIKKESMAVSYQRALNKINDKTEEVKYEHIKKLNCGDFVYAFYPASTIEDREYCFVRILENCLQRQKNPLLEMRLEWEPSFYESPLHRLYFKLNQIHLRINLRSDEKSLFRCDEDCPGDTAVELIDHERPSDEAFSISF